MIISVFQWFEASRLWFFLKKPTIIIRVLVVTVILFVFFIGLDFCFPLPRFMADSRPVYSSDSVLLHLSLSADQKWRLSSRPGSINPELKKVILFREDRWFYYHPGVNAVAVLRAAAQNLLAGQRVSGASTITMQVARLLERRPRTHLSKIVEMFRAFQLEWHYSKDAIFRMWIDHVSFGGNIEGIRAASWLYYGSEPGVLSQAQMATLLVIPNNPNQLRPGRNNPLLLAERNRWLSLMHQARLLSATSYHTAINEPVTMYRRSAPFEIPHLARKLFRDNPGDQPLYTTIDMRQQQKVEQAVADACRSLRYKGIGNVAALVMNNTSGAVVAYAGSGGFDDAQWQGQVDGLKAVRSPGSTLKPLLYALAFDKGMLTPLMTLNDVPVNFAGYTPENYDQQFNGKVTASDALARSLNIPAVKILDQLGTDAFAAFLAEAGFKTIARDRKRLGLSMILGGCGVTAIELAGAYSAFARGGVALVPRFTSQSVMQTDTLFGPEAAWMVARVLTLPVRPDLPMLFDNSSNLPPVAWKTGTSYGRRDAWAVGFNSHFTIVVWAGNFDGKGAIDLSGADVATPILFNLFQALDKNPVRNWLKQPPTVRFREVCSESGLLPGDSCRHLISDAYIPYRSVSARCEHLKIVWTNKQGTMSYCADCLPADGAVRRWYPNLAPELLEWYVANKIPFKAIPPHNPRCERVMVAGAPAIVSPVADAEYLIAATDSTPLMFTCQARADVALVHWYVNHHFVKTARRSESLFIRPPAGKVVIGCSDDKGRSSTIAIQVRYY